MKTLSNLINDAEKMCCVLRSKKQLHPFVEEKLVNLETSLKEFKTDIKNI